ncbi:unnamed protein product [Vitrella brassicaformis CCMP3155]|uniref:RING-type domain-containing protein n=3 Tax=Vitrella brassicaformis TaxID=1169539 RepID=A0A0G4EMR1_VITBC|nr:unnamed protein product [Vitrella brassicaformis CCMP3155]|eukprot:CEL99117.1 unnamed protein product [Vitrella brassicaformis CCMP3155]
MEQHMVGVKEWVIKVLNMVCLKGHGAAQRVLSLSYAKEHLTKPVASLPDLEAFLPRFPSLFTLTRSPKGEDQLTVQKQTGDLNRPSIPLPASARTGPPRRAFLLATMLDIVTAEGGQMPVDRLLRACGYLARKQELLDELGHRLVRDRVWRVSSAGSSRVSLCRQDIHFDRIMQQADGVASYQQRIPDESELLVGCKRYQQSLAEWMRAAVTLLLSKGNSMPLSAINTEASLQTPDSPLPPNDTLFLMYPWIFSTTTDDAANDTIVTLHSRYQIGGNKGEQQQPQPQPQQQQQQQQQDGQQQKHHEEQQQQHHGSQDEDDADFNELWYGPGVQREDIAAPLPPADDNANVARAFTPGVQPLLAGPPVAADDTEMLPEGQGEGGGGEGDEAMGEVGADHGDSSDDLGQSPRLHQPDETTVQSLEKKRQEVAILQLAVQQLQRTQADNDKKIKALERDKRAAEDKAVEAQKEIEKYKKIAATAHGAEQKTRELEKQLCEAQSRYDAAWDDPAGAAWTKQKYVYLKRALQELERPVRQTKGLTDKLTCSICKIRLWDHVLQPCGHVVCGTCVPSKRSPCPVCHRPVKRSAKMTLPYTTDDLPTVPNGAYEYAVDQGRRAKRDGPPAHHGAFPSLLASTSRPSKRPREPSVTADGEAEEAVGVVGDGGKDKKVGSPQAAAKAAPSKPQMQRIKRKKTSSTLTT